jgi:hypothetical protein
MKITHVLLLALQENGQMTAHNNVIIVQLVAQHAHVTPIAHHATLIIICGIISAFLLVLLKQPPLLEYVPLAHSQIVLFALMEIQIPAQAAHPLLLYMKANVKTHAPIKLFKLDQHVLTVPHHVILVLIQIHAQAVSMVLTYLEKFAKMGAHEAHLQYLTFALHVQMLVVKNVFQQFLIALIAVPLG